MGTEDSRSNIMFQCIKVIQKKLPKIFILENVKNFKFIEKGKPFNYLVKELENIKNGNKEIAYNVYTDILNTKDYGIPQNRERIFFIGIRKDIQKEIYTTPDKLPMQDLDNFIIDKTIKDILKNKQLEINLKKINYEKNCIVTSCNYYFPIKYISPTLTTYCSIYYSTTYKRYLTTKECLSLQGFPQNFIQDVSNTQMFKQVGNSMSVNVLKELIKKIIQITNM
jgi:DNA (cytosine-5)-methyltransferase 1